MDYQQEQRDEKESIQMIYEDRFEEGNDDNKFKLYLYPYTVENEDSKELNHVGAAVQITYPDEYPDVIPEINVHNLKGLNNQLISELTEKLVQVAHECVGSVMVFNILSTAQDWLLEKNDEHVTADSDEEEEEQSEAHLSAYERMMLERQRAQQELKGLNRYVLDASLGKGTAVTVDNFVEWKKRFDEERRQVQEALKKQLLQQQLQSGKVAKEQQEGKLTGREWFEQKSKWFNDAIQEDDEEDIDIDDDLFLEDEEDQPEDDQ